MITLLQFDIKLIKMRIVRWIRRTEWKTKLIWNAATKIRSTIYLCIVIDFKIFYCTKMLTTYLFVYYYIFIVIFFLKHPAWNYPIPINLFKFMKRFPHLDLFCMVYSGEEYWNYFKSFTHLDCWMKYNWEEFQVLSWLIFLLKEVN